MSGLRSLSREQRLVALPAVGLLLSLLLPWYRETAPGGASVVSSARSALAEFSWVEAALLLVAGSVLALLWLRAQRRGFHLPGGDAWAVTIAGGWAVALLVWRLFDRPDIPAGSVGVEWGIFVSMVMAGLLLAAGQRLRAAHVAEPPNPAATGEHEVVRRTAPRPVAAMPSREAARGDLHRSGDGAPSRAAARADLGIDDDLTRRLPADDDHATRRLRDDEDLTRRLPADNDDHRPSDDQDLTRHLPGDQDLTRRIPADDDRTHRLHDDQDRTRRLPPDDPDAARRPREDDERTRRLPPEDPDATRRLREDDERTRRLPPDDPDATRRLADDTRDAVRRHRETDEDATRRLPPDIPPPPSSPPPPPPPGRGRR